MRTLPTEGDKDFSPNTLACILSLAAAEGFKVVANVGETMHNRL